jgi:S-adenosylmethionine-diacylglycerol 3-amino-3-carboxypropyl transferase
MKSSEIQHRADFSQIRYAQCWEDSLLLSTGLKPNNRHCISIGSAGDNSFALLAHGAASVTAVEMNPTQVACIELRRAAYLSLSHQEFLELLGSRPSAKRIPIYQKCRGIMPKDYRNYWDSQHAAIDRGIASLGKFENYFAIFRRYVLPLAHSNKRVRTLLQPRNESGRSAFYDEIWSNRRWRWIFQLFFSRRLMGALGRDPEFFRYVKGSVADRILDRTRHALVTLDPSRNPYLHWILTGTHGETLPDALEAKNFNEIREAIDAQKFKIANEPLESFLEKNSNQKFDAFNLSDIFEYMSEENTEKLLEKIIESSNPSARLAYWNMLAPRSRPESLASRLHSCTEEANELFEKDRAFFYSKFIIEEVSP